MDRRRFIKLTVAASVGTGAVSGVQGQTTETTSETVSEATFYSTSSLVDDDYRRLTDENTVAVWAEDSATNKDADNHHDHWWYEDDTQIPLVGVDGSVVGFGSTLVDDDNGMPADNATLVENVWDAKLDDGATVLWDESHNQYWTLDKFSEFEDRVEDAGYTLKPTYDMTDDFDSADAIVIAVPRWSFWDADLDALADFRDDGGVVFLVNQSDYNDYDETDNLNDICGRLGVSFRFNDDQVYDYENNAGASYEPTTTNFNTKFPFFDDGDDGDDGDGGDEPTGDVVEVVRVNDGDTVRVDLDGTEENVRILGHDTPEKEKNQFAERPPEWEGIESLDTLAGWADDATEFGKEKLADETVELRYDDAENKRDQFDRLLAYVYYDATGDGARDSLYNLEAVEEGYARIYDSSFSKHEAFWNAEREARKNDRGLWGESDPENSPEIRNRAVEDIYFPKASGVRKEAGSISKSRVPVYAESSASWDGSYSGDKIPLVGVDESTGVAMVGAPLISESYESEEGFDVDTADYENFVFLTNLLDSLSSTDGSVLIDGGHGQFGADYALSGEDAAYYQRYLEGVGIEFEGINNLTASNLERGRALVVTTPVSSFDDEEIDALTTFCEDGGAVLLLGSGAADSDPRSNLNDLASGLGTDLRLGSDTVTDYDNNLNYDEKLVTTSQFNSSFSLFESY